MPKNAAQDFITNFFLPANNPTGLNRIGLVSYSTTATIDSPLVGQAGQGVLSGIISSYVATGGTNTEASINSARSVLNNATFNCTTSRNVIFLTDGVPTYRANGTSCNQNPTSPTECSIAAVNAAPSIQVINSNGQNYNQSVFAIGLFGGISGAQQTLATNVLLAIENQGLFATEAAANLGDIYDDILGQISFAARSLPGEPLVANQIAPGFALVPGSIVSSLTPDASDVSVNGNIVNWNVAQVGAETITLQYDIVAVDIPNVCGLSDSGSSVINYESSACTNVTRTFPSPQFCVPCPSLQAVVTRQACDNAIIYDGTLSLTSPNPSNPICQTATDNFLWTFRLNGNVIGTSTQIDGVFNYTGTAPFEGTLSATLAYNGTVNGGCPLTAADASTVTIIPNRLSVVSTPTDVSCFGGSDGSIDITVTGGTPPYTYQWSNGMTTQDIMNVPAGVYEVVVTDSAQCSLPVSPSQTTVGQPESVSILNH